MIKPIFLDLYPDHSGVDFFSCTNEDLLVHKEILDGSDGIRRIAGVASGGEVPLLVMLPKCDEVVAIDHSYRSLSYAYLKALMLAVAGPELFVKLLNEAKEFTKLANEIRPDLPRPLAKEIPSLACYPAGCASFRAEMYPYWSQFLSDIPTIYSKLDRIKFVHGDLTDLQHLSPEGGFDGCYLSNAPEKIDRFAGKVTIDKMAPIVREGGILIETRDRYEKDTRTDNPFWGPPDIKQRRSLGYSWKYCTYKRLPASAASAATEVQDVSAACS